MNTRKETKTRTKTKATGPARRVGAYVLTFSCMALLAVGFFFAAHQHFSSMDYGMKNSRLRKQIDQLEAEKRRLILAKEISLSPTEIKKAAKKAGMTDAFPVDGQLMTAAAPLRTKSAPAALAIEKTLVTKTAAVKAVPAPVSAVYKKSDRSGIEVKRAISAE